MKPFYYILILTFVLGGCGATVVVDYDSRTDFSNYQSFDFYPDIDSGLSDLDNKRIIRIADSLLQESGFVRSDQPDFLINFYASEHLQNPRSTIGVGVGQSSRHTSIGVSGGIPVGGRVIAQQLTVDFVDRKKDQLFWKAEASGELKERATPEQKEKYYVDVVTKILKKYPTQILNEER